VNLQNKNNNMTQEEIQSTLNKALVSAIAETKDVHANDFNPHFKSKFANLAAHLEVIKPIFAKHGLAILQFPATECDMVGVKTKIIHINGGCYSEFVGVPAKADMNGQQAGAVISYLRRYALASVAGVATEDDDAESDRASSAPAQNTTEYFAPKKTYTPKSAPATVAPQGSFSGPLDVEIHFGKNKGVKLGSLNEKQIQWYQENYKAEGFAGRPPKAVDLALRAALDELAGVSTKSEQSDDSDEVPF
jgi:hypothetical protein